MLLITYHIQECICQCYLLLRNAIHNRSFCYNQKLIPLPVILRSLSSFAPCHSERSEESLVGLPRAAMLSPRPPPVILSAAKNLSSATCGFFAALRMTGGRSSLFPVSCRIKPCMLSCNHGREVNQGYAHNRAGAPLAHFRGY